jgi:succinoglycan biosynthesis protein ExoA
VRASSGGPEVRQHLRVSVVVPCRNEMAHLTEFFEALTAQSRPPDEVLVVDGMSEDGSAEWLGARAADDHQLILLRNPQCTVPSAMNLGIDAASGDVIARMDVHAAYAEDYLERLVCLLEERPEIAAAGGTYLMRGRGAWGSAIAAVLSHPVALGGAPHRRGRAAGWVTHVGTGVYRRSVLVEVGGFDPTLLANEDFELDYRLTRAGHLIWLDPEARFTSYCRPDPRSLARQMWRYGFYKGRTLVLHPASLKPRQLAPPVLVGLFVLTPWINSRWAARLIGAYVATAGAVGSRVARRSGASSVRGAATLPMVHLVWGAGVLVGLPTHALRRARAARPRRRGYGR